MYNMEIATPIKQLERARSAVEKAKERYDKIKDGLTSYDPEVSEQSTILCKKCNKRSQIRNVQYAKWYWYERPHGCMGGDTWHWGGYIIVCPKCNHWEVVHRPHKFGGGNYDMNVMEFRILEKMLPFAKQCNDQLSKDGWYEDAGEIKDYRW